MSFYNGSKWNEDATEIDPEILKIQARFLKQLKGPGGPVVKPVDEVERFEEADRIQKRLGFKLNYSPYRRRR